MDSDPSPCPLDAAFSAQVAALLEPPPLQSSKEYYDMHIKSIKCDGISIQQKSNSSKGLYAETDFKEDQLVFKDQMLVGAQHSSNKMDCLVCSYCFRYIGSIELQIGRKLHFQSLVVDDKMCCHHQPISCSPGACITSFSDDKHPIKTGGCCAGSYSMNLKDGTCDQEVLDSLMNGSLSLPYTKQFALSPVITCPGGCEEEHYCSILCAESDWDSVHSLLCTGGISDSSCSATLRKFVEHANSTNDIFILAAKVISFTILRYKKLRFDEQNDNQSQQSRFSLLLEAWKPVSMGFKKRWWDSIALPADVSSDGERSFRMQIRDLAFESLQILKEAIFEQECAPLFSLEIYGHIIGMFELNNLDLVVESPVEDYFIFIDDLPSPEKEEAERLTRPFLDALGDEYSVFCQGTAFFPLQSCMNHSCNPNAKAFKREEDRDGQATIIALRQISKGDEITISYIDEDLPYEERQALLADYGFQCRCSKCEEEEEEPL